MLISRMARHESKGPIMAQSIIKMKNNPILTGEGFSLSDLNPVEQWKSKFNTARMLVTGQDEYTQPARKC